MDARSLLDHPIVASRYFYPRRAPLTDPFVVARGEVELHCHRSALHAGAPLLLHFHGNGEVVRDWLPELPRSLAEQGIDSLLAEYRGYGGSTGAPALATMLDDALAICDAAGVPPEQVIVYGRSVGSIFAAHVAAHRPVAALVLESGIADVYQRLALRVQPEELGVDEPRLRAAVEQLCDQRAKLQAFGGPVLVLHTRNDHLVTLDHAERLAAWAGARGRLQLFELGDHNTIHAYNHAAIIAAVAALARG